jgi:serine/threonine protein kinase
MFVHWAFRYTEVLGAPVALFRYRGSDLDKFINSCRINEIEKLSIICYVCVGLRHCYKKGLRAHQDLKPANIFLRDIKSQFLELPNLDVYTIALIGDFGLADAFRDSNIFDGSRPYMAPEQWTKSELSPKTDVFSLGVILFELMSNGHHPAGIKLRDFWPHPLNGISKKWTRPAPWKKWAEGNEKISKNIAVDIDPKLLELIRAMLSASPLDRPDIDDVLATVLDSIKSLCPESYGQICFLLNFFENQASNKALEEQWPFLFHSWSEFESKFDSHD